MPILFFSYQNKRPELIHQYPDYMAYVHGRYSMPKETYGYISDADSWFYKGSKGAMMFEPFEVPEEIRALALLLT